MTCLLRSLSEHDLQVLQNRDLFPTKSPINSYIFPSQYSWRLRIQMMNSTFSTRSGFHSSAGIQTRARFDEDGMAFLAISCSIFLLVLTNTLVLVDNHSGTIFTPIFLHRCLSLLLMARLAMPGGGRQEEGSKGQEISFPTIKE